MKRKAKSKPDPKLARALEQVDQLQRRVAALETEVHLHKALRARFHEAIQVALDGALEEMSYFDRELRLPRQKARRRSRR